MILLLVPDSISHFCISAKRKACLYFAILKIKKMINSIKEVYLKNLNALLNEITLYANEDDLWKTGTGISNSGGNLTLHLIGNLNYFIGTNLGNSGFVRDRDSEFADKDVPKQKLIDDFQVTINMVETTLSGMKDEDINKPYPIDKFGEGKTIGYVLTYLLAHLNYHLGQINYHRRLLNS